MSENVKSFFLIIIAAASLYLAFRSNSRLSKQDLKNAELKTKAEAVAGTKTNTVIEIKLDYINKGMDDIKFDNRGQNEKIDGVISQLSDMKSQVTGVEESVKSAHKRIDMLTK